MIESHEKIEKNVILCMKWGTKYTVDYVNRLYAMVDRYLTLPFEMVCLTDNSEGINPNVTCFPIPALNLPPNTPERGWNKLSTFEANLYGLEANVLFLDLDVIIIDNIDCFFDQQGDFLIIHDWKHPWRITGNSSVYRFKAGAFPDVLTYFRENLDNIRNKFRNEQAYLSWFMHQRNILSYWPKSWCRSYKYHCLKNIPLGYFMPPIKPKNAKK